jgi:hypothetical protein
MHSQNDRRHVALVKSLTTKNRFYTLVEPERGIRNADMVDVIPEDLILGIAYPCLEDGLNDFAVIRTTFETLDLFPEDDPIREEMMEIVEDARTNLVRRLKELRDKIYQSKAFFLGTDYDEFKGRTLDMVKRGYRRLHLDSMMKLTVFVSVAEAEGESASNELMYHYEFVKGTPMSELVEMPARAFIVSLFNDVLTSVTDDANYRSKYLFDRNVFQKFIAVMFVNYATTDPIFYGINRSDYGVSGDKDMDDTPLYVAIRRELLEIEERLHSEPHEAGDLRTDLALVGVGATVPAEETSVRLPAELINEEVLLGPITSLCAAASLLERKSDVETQRFARVIMADASKLVDELKRLNIISPLTNNPCDCP